MDNPYPWYDSSWLADYTQAKSLIERVRPEALPEFAKTFEVLRTRPDFEVKEFSRVFSNAALEDIRQAVRQLRATQLELHELHNFHRFIVHNHPLISKLHESVIGLASEAAGEPVEPCYNFLSLYTKLGVCPVHMDAPDAKWTLDLCIRQSEPWPIHLSQVVPWPEPSDYEGDNWQDLIKQDPDLRFESYSLEPGSAIFFSGSSQWHYRDPHPGGDQDHYCDLVFFHFVPMGMRETVDRTNWPQLFGVPELAELHDEPVPS
jgi:hypothetical protein